MSSVKGVRVLEVKGLFGLADRSIPFSDSGLTIVHGPNGSGKTIMLRILHSLLSGRLSELSSLPFEFAQVTFRGGATISVKREDPSGKRVGVRDSVGLELQASDDHGRRLGVYKWGTAEPRKGRRRGSSEDFRLWTSQQLRALSGWFDDDAADALDRNELAHRYREALPSEFIAYMAEGYAEELPAWLRELQEQYAKTRFISTQRLVRYTEPRSELRGRSRGYSEAAINLKARRLATALKDRLSELSQRSAELDRTFPERVFRRWHESVPHQKSAGESRDLEHQLVLMQQSRQKLVQAGMAPPGELIDIADVPASEMAQGMLAVYLDDIARKTAVVKRFADRVNLFMELVNNRLTNKQLVLDGEVGFHVKTTNGTTITPDKLSSGEQHQVVITYELLFEVPDDALVLIDEPELSLHVQWQIQFLDEVDRIRGVVPFELLVATHSPQIVNDRWSSTVSLVETNSVGDEG